jgi:hypothetical protein
MRTRIASRRFVPELTFLYFCQVTRCRASRNCPFRHGSPMAARAGAVKVGRRTELKAGADVDRPHLDGDEHDATLEPAGWTLGLQPCGGCRPRTLRGTGILARAEQAPDRQRHRHVQAECGALHALQGSDARRGSGAKPASAGLERGLDRERLDSYISAARRLIWKTPWRSWKTSEKSAVKSAASVGNGVTVAQQTLTLFV